MKRQTPSTVPASGRHRRKPPQQDRILTVSVPMKLARCGSRKVVITPDGTKAIPAPQVTVVTTLVKAIARAYRWKDMMESGNYASVTDLAKAEKINDSYVSRMLRLTLLAPDIVEAILDGRHATDVALNVLAKPFGVEWQSQRSALR